MVPGDPYNISKGHIRNNHRRESVEKADYLANTIRVRYSKLAFLPAQ